MVILCVMRIPPDLEGHGGSQRAWRLLHALRRIGPVHFVLVSRKTDHDAQTVSLEPLRPLVESVVSIDIPDWMPTQKAPPIPKFDADWITFARMGSQEAPRISDKGLEAIAAQLPVRQADLVFAGRLCSAVIVQQLIDKGLLKARAKIVDFDDVMSRFRRRQRQFLWLRAKVIATVDTWLIRRAEDRIARTWDAVSVCTDEDVEALRQTYPQAHVVKVPNVIERDALPAREDDGRARLLFVGNLSFAPNVHGLQLFMDEAWPRILADRPDTTLQVVGINPNEQVHALHDRYGFELHANVPSVRPYYANNDIVLAPILIGSGTRIKILEAMAYGRVVVATPMAAEGMDLIDGEHIVLAQSMEDFAKATTALSRDPERRRRIAQAARDFVARRYGVRVLEQGVDEMVAAAQPSPMKVPA